MNRIKFLSVLFFSIIFSCSTENDNNEDIESFNVKETYERIVYTKSSQNRDSYTANSIDMVAYEALTDSQKAELWNYKYQLFENSSDFSQTQTEILNNVKEFSRNAIANGNYNDETASALDLLVQEHFSIDQYVDLMFYLNNPSVQDVDSNASARLGCFWCNEIVGEGSCRLTYHNGNAVVVKTVEFRRRRFLIGWSTGFADVPCSDDEIFEQWDDIF